MSPGASPDAFDDTKVENKSADGLTLTMSTSARHIRFLLGTDTSGSYSLTGFQPASTLPLTLSKSVGTPAALSADVKDARLRDVVPAVRLTMAVMRKPIPGDNTKPAEDSSARAMPMDWNSAKPSVP